ncbi:MAG TPA: radical SAM protein [Thermoanaerobaculia bacterium]|nr:radical SAM protein [Thermoanaerobaculia bacterium]
MSAAPPLAYPTDAAARDRWIVSKRPPRRALDPRRAAAAFLEEEPDASGELVPVAAIFLTNRECPWRCLMCDLWKNTLSEPVAPGAIPAQIQEALRGLGPARRVKLYNAGSFFDPRAIPPADFDAIAALVRPFERVVVEAHPALVGDSCRRFRDLAGGALEVAMGLETVHEPTLERLNKRMTLDDFAAAADFLAREGVALRAFVLAGLPFLDEAEGLAWARRSIAFAFDRGAAVVSVIPTRGGNGALDALSAAGLFADPRLSVLEDTVDFGLDLRRGRVFADLWDLDRFRRCGACFDARAARLAETNRRQQVLPRIRCGACGGRG